MSQISEFKTCRKANCKRYEHTQVCQTGTRDQCLNRRDFCCKQHYVNVIGNNGNVIYQKLSNTHYE